MKAEQIKHTNIFYPPGGILLWIIIYIELLTFGIALITMVFYSKEELDIFHSSRLLLNNTIGTINTIFLITSGYFMTQSVQFLKKNQIKKSSLFLKITMFGGLLFLGLKVLEYAGKLNAGLTIGYNTFFSFYWMLTLFNLIHVVVGIIILAFAQRDLNKNQINANLEDFEASATFWHMCDLIWLLLFPVIYLSF